ncbi:MAG: hypothetical protein IIB00_10780 [candidate division Zixibacteria bacterium]|nr:hypothetical protein [candidate division Zixibacteria bacterium]
MKKLFYLTAPVVILALFVSGCSQNAPTAASESEGAQKIAAPAVSSEIVALSAEAVGNPIGNCCPEGFSLEAVATLNPADLNGDGAVCRRVTPGGTITINNNAPGNCSPPCIPPDCGGGGG